MKTYIWLVFSYFLYKLQHVAPYRAVSAVQVVEQRLKMFGQRLGVVFVTVQNTSCNGSRTRIFKELWLSV